MSAPYSGNNDENWDPGDGFGDLPKYGSTNHPEDQPGYGQSSYGQPGYGQPYSSGYDSNYGATGYSGAQFGGAGYSDQGFGQSYGHETLIQTHGKLQVFKAIGFGFKRTFTNAKLWLLGSVAFLLVFMVLGAIIGMIAPAPAQADGTFQVGTDWASSITGVISLALMPFIYRLATMEVDTRDNGWGKIGKDVHFLPTLGILLVMWLVGIVVSVVFTEVAFGGILSALEAAGTNEDAIMQAFVDHAGAAFGGLLLFMIIVLCATPFYQLMPWYAADGRAGVIGSITNGCQNGAVNFLPLLGFNIAMGFLMVVITIFTLGLGMFIVMPVYLLAQAHAYRQIAGGPVPADSVEQSFGDSAY